VLVDEQLPEIVGDVVGLLTSSAIIEPDRRLVGIRSPSEGLCGQLLRRLEDRLADTAHTPSLIRRYGGRG
jgi:hypothetical protein